MAINAEFIGSGYLALRDTAGNAYPVGVLKDLKLSIASSIKELTGPDKVAILTAEVGKAYTLTAKHAELSSALLALAMGGTIATGSKWVQTDVKSVAAGSLTVTPPSSGVFVTDLGVKYVANNQPLKKVASAPSAGQYSVNESTGAYTFNVADNGTNNVTPSYVYSLTGGETISVSNSAIGLSNYFEVWTTQATTQTDGTVRRLGWHFFAALLPKLDVNFSSEDFTMSDLEIRVFADAQKRIAEVSAI